MTAGSGGDVTAVELHNVSKVFDGQVTAVSALNLAVTSGEFLVLLGPSGCGKSTVLRMIAGLEEPTSGEVFLNGEPAGHLTPRQRGAAMVFQSFALYPHMNVSQNITFPLQLSGMSGADRDAKAMTMASALGIAELMERQPAQLSGGQRQRVAMGRALVRRPSLFLMDEPLSNLDVGLRSELRAEISRLAADLGVTTIYVTHDQTEALTMADRVAVLSRGRLQDLGTTREIYERPQTSYVAAFVGTPRMNLVEAAVEVVLDRFVALHLGGQELRLPWGRLQSRAVARYHGERVTVGIRAESLRAGHRAGSVLNGRVETVEHHGHESLVGLDIGAVGVVPTGLRDERSSAPAARATGGFLNRFRNREDSPGSTGSAAVPGRHERPKAQLTVRMPPHSTPRLGQLLTVGVHTDELHYFDGYGNRIDSVRR